MDYSYDYIDVKKMYVIPITGVLRNLFHINNKEELEKLKQYISGIQIAKLLKQPIFVNDFTAPYDIHQFIFGEIYEWAGKLRTLDMSKSGRYVSLTQEKEFKRLPLTKFFKRHS
jgi:cell filamentation protein